MSLEEDLKQKRFATEYHKAAVNILFTGSWLYTINSAFLKKFDVTPEQFNVLRILRGSHPRQLMLAEIASRMIEKNSNATRLVEKLRQKGMVKREICENNRRQVDISITEKGLSLLKKIDAGELRWIENLHNLNKSEVRQLNTLLDKLRGT